MKMAGVGWPIPKNVRGKRRIPAVRASALAPSWIVGVVLATGMPWEVAMCKAGGPEVGRACGFAGGGVLLEVVADGADDLPVSNTVIMPLGGDDAAYRALAAPFVGRVMWVELACIQPDSGARREVVCSAVRLTDRCVLTAAHCVAPMPMFAGMGSGGCMELRVGAGKNYLTEPGETRRVASVTVYPGYIEGNPTQAPDVAILTLEEPLPGGPFPGMAIADVAPGQTIISVGFGAFGHIGAAALSPSGGSPRAWHELVQAQPVVPISPPHSFEGSAVFDNADPSGLLPGCGAPGDSGGPAFNAAGQLVGLTTHSYWGYQLPMTGHLRLAEPAVLAWIMDIATDCRTDFDASGALDSADVFGFIDAWLAGDLRADFDGSGGLEVADIFTFLNAWLGGC